MSDGIMPPGVGVHTVRERRDALSEMREADAAGAEHSTPEPITTDIPVRQQPAGPTCRCGARTWSVVCTAFELMLNPRVLRRSEALDAGVGERQVSRPTSSEPPVTARKRRPG